MVVRRRALKPGTETGEASALETDVVRFVAIVGLTLMVIFALVHSLPYEGRPAEPEVEIVPVSTEPVELHAEPGPGDRVTVSRGELERMERSETELEAARLRLSATAEARRVLEGEVAALRTRIGDLGGDLRRTRDELERTKRSLAGLQAHAGLEDDSHVAEVSSLRAQIDRLEEELRRAANEAAGQQVALDERGESVESTEHGEPPAVLVLRFRDDAVYLDLLARERIRSYLRIPELDLTYRVLHEAPERLRFSLEYRLGDGELWKIPDGTVPEILHHETRRFDLKLSLRDDLDYLVVLSDEIRRQVERLRSAGEVGVYDILTDERVVPAGERS